MLPMIWVNGKRVAADELALSPVERGFTRADGIFETMRGYNGNLFRLEDHLDRLSQGAAKLRLNVPETIPSQIDESVKEAVAQGHTDFAFRLTLSRGASASVSLLPDNSAQPTVVITISQIPKQLDRGLRIKMADGRKNLHSATVGVKTLAYTESIIELVNAQESGFDDVLFLDTDGNVSEATTSNVFLAKNGELITPSEDCAILAGITRKVVMEIAAELSLPVTERKISPTELEQADEIFLTSSVREIAPVAQLEQRTITNYNLTDNIIQRFKVLTLNNS